MPRQITMIQIPTGLSGCMGCLVCVMMIRTVLGSSVAITAFGTTQQTDRWDVPCMRDGDATKGKTLFLLIILCLHLASNWLLGRVTVGNLNYSLSADIADWCFNLVEYGMAIHLLEYFKALSDCVEATAAVSADDFVYAPHTVWSLLVAWIAFDTFLFLVRVLVSYILYKKLRSKGYQRKYLIQ